MSLEQLEWMTPIFRVLFKPKFWRSLMGSFILFFFFFFPLKHSKEDWHLKCLIKSLQVFYFQLCSKIWFVVSLFLTCFTSNSHLDLKHEKKIVYGKALGWGHYQNKGPTWGDRGIEISCCTLRIWAQVFTYRKRFCS